MLEVLRERLAPEDLAPLIRPGLHHFARERDGRVVRYHLRVEEDGAGLLLCNASAAVRLSPSGVMMAQRLLAGGAGDLGIAREVAECFDGASPARVEADVAALRRTLDELADPRGRYPIVDLDDPGATLHRRALSAPLCADLELGDDEDIERALRRLWDATVPQVVLLNDADVEAESLVRAVELAEDLGLVCGVRTRGSDLDPATLAALAAAGLDHVDVLYASADGDAHDALLGEGDHRAAEALLEAASEHEVCAVGCVPLVADTVDAMEETAAALRGHGVRVLSVFAVATDDATEDDGGLFGLRQAALMAEEIADRRDMTLVWAPPVTRDVGDRIAEQVEAGPRSGGEGTLRVEADGSVLPPSGPPRSAGNLLEEEWRAIWAHEIFHHFRHAVDDPARCDVCPGLSACSAGCVQDDATWATGSSAGDDR